MSYENPTLLPHDAAATAFEAVLGGDLPKYDPNSVLIGLGLYDSDRGFVEQWAVRIGERTNDASLRDSAAVALGHFARRFGEISDEGRAFVSRAVNHPMSDGRAGDAADDIQWFAPT
jgi:hypothetical protein